MLFKKKNCPHCESEYDEMLDYCPYCKKANEELIQHRQFSQITYIPFYRQLILIGIALFGFLSAQIIFSILLNGIYQADNIKGTMLINTLSYLVFFGGIIAVIYPYLGAFWDRLKSFRPFLIGIVTCIAVVGGETLIGLIINQIHPTHTGGNQSVAELFVLNYPVVAILILGIIGPICEEFGYRVGLFSFLKRVHPVLAYLGTGLVFALIHFDFTNPDLINELLLSITYFWAGIVFSLSYEIGGIGASSFGHILNNLFSIIVILMGLNI